MARSENNLHAVLADTAAAIKAKKGDSTAIIPRDFADEIVNLPSGGGGTSTFPFKTIITLTGYSNGAFFNKSKSAIDVTANSSYPFFCVNEDGFSEELINGESIYFSGNSASYKDQVMGQVVNNLKVTIQVPAGVDMSGFENFIYVKHNNKKCYICSKSSSSGTYPGGCSGYGHLAYKATVTPKQSFTVDNGDYTYGSANLLYYMPSSTSSVTIGTSSSYAITYLTKN